MSRAAETWTAWDRAREAGKLPTEMARDLTDEELARMISEAGAGRDDERKLLAAESLRRATDLSQAKNEDELPPDPGAESHRRVVNEAAERVHGAERRLERASASQKVGPALERAHEASLHAEEHRGHVETNIELRARHRQEVRDLRETLARRSREHGTQDPR